MTHFPMTEIFQQIQGGNVDSGFAPVWGLQDQEMMGDLLLPPVRLRRCDFPVGLSGEANLNIGSRSTGDGESGSGGLPSRPTDDLQVYRDAYEWWKQELTEVQKIADTHVTENQVEMYKAPAPSE